MKKMLFGLVLAGLMLGGCGAGEEKIVTENGVIQVKMGEEYVLKTDDKLINMASNKVNLDDYMKKTVEVKGMYSGNTLYVDEINLK